jgi:octopine/nopaline transport system permease protein/arginine/ornithine transport system permease protein
MSWHVVWDNAGWLLEGFWVTLQLTASSVTIGLLLALILSLLTLSTHRYYRWPAETITFFFRGTPLLVQLFLVYYGSGQFRQELDSIGLWTYFREAHFCAIFVLALNTAAYSSEIFSGAIRSVDRNQMEAGRAVGMTTFILYRRIVLPQALRIGWTGYSNEIIFIMQATSLVSIITVLDLTGVAGRIISKTFAIYEVYIAIALMYLAITYAMVFIFSRLEKRLNRHKA